MDKKLIINTNLSETRVALLEEGRLAELYVERDTRRGLVGNIYKAKVSRVLPGMQSAFVNIGMDRSAFLFGGDVLDEGYIEYLKGQSEQDDPRKDKNQTPIQSLLSVGQEIMVQVAKEPLGTKGPRVTMLVAIPGRYLVLMPEVENIGISRRIEEPALRQELEEFITKLCPKGMGVIVRTAAADASKAQLERDLNYLQKLWMQVKKSYSVTPSPALLYQEPDIVIKTTRDLYSDEVSEIIIDDEQAYSQLQHFLLSTIPGSNEKLRLHESSSPVFDSYGIELDIAKALSRKVWLPSGGYLVIDQTEALTSFDVNTGKFVGSQNVSETILKTNLEAIDEATHQMRLRNLGGIIIMDCIDMDNLADREKVNHRLEEALKSDKSRTCVLAINEFGLIQMTRKRTRESLERVLSTECAHCNGLGHVLSVETLTYELLRDMERFIIRTGMSKIRVRANQAIIDRLHKEENQLFHGLLNKFQVEVEFSVNHLTAELLQEAPYEVG